jgi:hypothetical protein
MLRTKQPVHIVVFVLFVAIGWGWVLNIVDIIVMVVTGKLLFTE